jgi:hypothetical protein
MAQAQAQSICLEGQASISIKALYLSENTPVSRVNVWCDVKILVNLKIFSVDQGK